MMIAFATPTGYRSIETKHPDGCGNTIALAKCRHGGFAATIAVETLKHFIGQRGLERLRCGPA